MFTIRTHSLTSTPHKCSDHKPSTTLDITWSVWLLSSVLLVSTALGSPSEVLAQETTRVSVASDGTQGNGISTRTAISTDGRYVAFSSTATNLVADDTNGESDVFVHDRVTETTERVSVASDGTEGNGKSVGGVLSVDGRYVAFLSFATNFVAGDTNGDQVWWHGGDVFLHDRVTKVTERVSVASDGTEGNHLSALGSLSADGRYVTFNSWASNLVAGDTNGDPSNPQSGTDVFVHDRVTGLTERVSVASDGTEAESRSEASSLSADGRYVAFWSFANNLVGEDTNEHADIFVHDRVTKVTERVSVASDGTEADNSSWGSHPILSADGRYVAFNSMATNLVMGDTNGRRDIFVHDRQTDTTERVNVASDGTEADHRSWYPALSADGRYVAFYSTASNLVGSDTNGNPDIFVHDRQTDALERVSVASDGTEGDGHNFSWTGPAISANGRHVAFFAGFTNLVPGDTNGKDDVFVHTRFGDPITPPVSLTVTPSGTGHGTVSSAGGEIDCGVDCQAEFLVGSVVPLSAVADPGSVFAGWSGGTDWTGTDCSGTDACTVIMTQAHTVTATFTAESPTESDGVSSFPDVSADGRYVAFASLATNLVADDTNGKRDIYVLDRQTGALERVSVASDGTEGEKSSHVPAISADARFVAFESVATTLVINDTNGVRDIFIHDRQTGTTERVSVASDGAESDAASEQPAISGDGRYVAFRSDATNLVRNDANGWSDIFVHDRQTGTTERVSGGGIGEDHVTPVLSADGRYVAFRSRLSPRVCCAIYVHDRETGRTRRVNVTPSGQPADRESLTPVLSGDGRYVAYMSAADTLVAGDTKNRDDIFVYDQQTRTTERVSVASDGTEGDRDSWKPALSADGRYVAFVSKARNLVAGDTNRKADIFVHDRQADTTTRVSVASDRTEGDNASLAPALSADGHDVVFASEATTLVTDDTNGTVDIFLHDQQTGTTERVSLPE